MLFLAFPLLILTSIGRADEPDVEQSNESDWHGYEKTEWMVDGRSAYLVAPSQAAAGKPWVWRARFPNYHFEMDLLLLEQGFHVAHVDVAGLFGNPASIKVGDEFYRQLTTKHGLSKKVVLEGVSRGGLFVYNWAAQNADSVACIYCDTPVCDIRSWPGGKGSGIGAEAAWKQCLDQFGLNEETSKRFLGNPIDHAAVIATARIPILHIVSESDQVVPPDENTYELKRRLEALGHPLEVISVAEGTQKSSGHHFTHPDPQRVVQFIHTHALSEFKTPTEILEHASRVVFLGDSITYAGHYVAFFDAWLQTRDADHTLTVIDAGLSSETVSGLSEDGHAGGRFPRPNLSERLDRVLKLIKPDLIFACYGINCGIYQPFDEERMLNYRNGIEHLVKSGEAIGATVVLVTPPFYDDMRSKKTFSYDAVLERYSRWLISQRDEQGWNVIDLHSGMRQDVMDQRKSNPEFTYQRDAVHPNEDGHWLIARQLIGWFGDAKSAGAESPEVMLEINGVPGEILEPVRERVRVRRDAYLNAAGHKRPGVKEGLPVDEAERRASQLTQVIEKLKSPM